LTPSLFLLWAYLFVVLGLSLAILGPSIPAFRADFGVSLSTAGVVFTLQSLGYLVGVLIAGPLADRYGRAPITSVGVVALVAGNAAAALSPTWSQFLAALTLGGLGFACVDVGLNAAIGDAMETAGKRATAMNLLHASFPIGTLAAPALLSLLWQTGNTWRGALMLIALATALPLAGLLTRRPRWPATGNAGAGAGLSLSSGLASLLRVAREPRLVRLSVLQGLYVGVEIALAGWITTYLIETFGAEEGAAALATSAYWAGFLLGRPAVALLVRRFEPHLILPWLIGISVCIAATGVVAPNALAATGIYFLAGVAISGVFPTVMALALEGRERDMGAVTALIAAAASVGSLIWPWLVGAVAEGVSLRVAMAVAAAPLLVMLPLSRVRPK
jgi:MFS transporter, FHS family, glucose/mannose:H+ symporter